MKLLILAIFAIAAASAVENYDGPEWQPIDWSKVVPASELPSTWEGTAYEKFAINPNPRTSRIVGGYEVVPHSHQYQVYLVVQLLIFASTCGGSLISHTVVLSAAHCFTNARSVTIVAGAHNIQQIEPTQQRRSVDATGFRVHPEYNRVNVLNDIATIIVPTPFVPDAFVQVIRIAPANAPSFVGFTAQSTGWGRVADGQTGSDVLRGVTNTIINNSICAETYGNVSINPNVICIDTTGGRGVCQGDSGGPLTVNENGRLQIGVVSFGHSSGCQSGFPHVFERISSHRDWLDRNMS
ncbi:brachyurin-like [Chironomus tepperi]|uniref:brachyurin-like n=1 Tax=Chironomus tepperi TaxID=113505 RepID=UPI00391F0479